MTLREAIAQAMMNLNTVTITGQSNIERMANAFKYLDAVDSKLADLEKEGAESGGV